MESIPYGALPALTHSPTSAASNLHVAPKAVSCPLVQQRCEPTPELVGQFYREAKRQIVKGDYLRRRWQPLYGPRFYALIKALRGFCSYEVKEGEAMCYPSEETVARACGISRRTLLYWFQRDPTGRFARKVKLPHGEVEWEEWTWSALQTFLRIAPKRRYDPVGQRSLKTSNRYFIRMDDPPVPEDEPLIWARAYELAEQYLHQQAEERERQARQEGRERSITQATSFERASCTLNNVQKLPAQQCAKAAQNRSSLPASFYPDSNRTIPDRQSGDEITIESSSPASSAKKTLVRGAASAATKQQQRDRETEKASQRSNASPETSQVEKRAPTPFELALAAAEEEAGSVLMEVLQQYGDPTPLVGMGTILVALVDAGAPVERLRALVELGRHRLRRREERGGHIRTTRQAYYIGILQHLAQQARERHWDVALMEREDQAEHEEFLRRRAMRRIGQQRRYIVPESEPREEPEAGAETAPEKPLETFAPVVIPHAFGGGADADPQAAHIPPDVPEGVEVADATTVATWYDHLPDPQGGQSRRVSVLWGFVREEIRGHLNIARRQHLDALVPKWDAARPRTLLLLCRLTYTARAVELSLRRELAPPFDKLLSRFFDEFQVVYAPGLEESA